MVNATVLEDAGDAGSSQPQPHPPTPTSFIYLALYDFLAEDDAVDEWLPDQLSWRLIPSESPTIPREQHEVFGIYCDSETSEVSSDTQLIDDPIEDIRAFIRLPVKSTRSYESLVDRVQTCSETLVNEAIEDGWQEWEWVYNVFEHLEVLEYLDDRVTNTWQYTNKSKMETFKERVLNLAKQVFEMHVPPEDRVIDFPLGP
ncbi:hypothetical protein AN958_11692 [Leucoagaricus sp. SymC.cos]|nr:hypothetical protein AN958_11692 [Leucoagaricus sp. SymC.cos]